MSSATYSQFEQSDDQASHCLVLDGGIFGDDVADQVFEFLIYIDFFSIFGRVIFLDEMTQNETHSQLDAPLKMRLFLGNFESKVR